MRSYDAGRVTGEVTSDKGGYHLSGTRSFYVHYGAMHVLYESPLCDHVCEVLRCAACSAPLLSFVGVIIVDVLVCISSWIVSKRMRLLGQCLTESHRRCRLPGGRRQPQHHQGHRIKSDAGVWGEGEDYTGDQKESQTYMIGRLGC